MPFLRRYRTMKSILIVEIFRMLADPTRVRVLWALTGGELSVTELAEQVANQRHRCRSTWPSCGWRGWSAPAETAPRSSTAWRTNTSASSSPMRCSTPNTPAPGCLRHHRGDEHCAQHFRDRQPAQGDSAMTHIERTATRIPRIITTTTIRAAARRDQGDLRAALA